HVKITALSTVVQYHTYLFAQLKSFLNLQAFFSLFYLKIKFRFIFITVLGSVFAVLTTGGNLMVMVSFKMDKQLQTISNYFLFSLAVADIAIGIFSIPLMTYYMASGIVWKLGYTMCQFWLCLDYLMCNASVLNLLLISFDRYFSVIRPLTYRPRRTAKKALIFISLTYIISLLLWPPWIISWPYIEGKCVIKFLETNQFASIGTAIAAFYLPLAIMIYLYSRVYCETRKRQSEISEWKKSYFRNCMGKSVSSEDSSDALATNADETSLTSSVVGTRANSLNRRTKNSPINKPALESRSFLKADVIDKPLTYTVLIEIKDNEGERPTVRLSSCDSDVCSALVHWILFYFVNIGKDDQRKAEKERKKMERKQERKAAKTLSAILLAFIITWTPYNVVVCWEALYKGSIPEICFHIAYALCYINSTINPLCYALCNARFRRTYLRILKGNWRQERLSINQNAFFRR
uniref:G_PROTEIN_RECEP_F1_2 domain-containing protein n=1 Tax=Syphacia muris TaxID=451379 RepID=A0A0N5AQD4_9BILA